MNPEEECWTTKNESEWTWIFEIRTRKKFLAVGEACVAIFWHTPGFKRGNIKFISSGFSDGEDLNFCVRCTRLLPNARLNSSQQAALSRWGRPTLHHKCSSATSLTAIHQETLELTVMSTVMCSSPQTAVTWAVLKDDSLCSLLCVDCLRQAALSRLLQD